MKVLVLITVFILSGIVFILTFIGAATVLHPRKPKVVYILKSDPSCKTWYNYQAELYYWMNKDKGGLEDSVKKYERLATAD